MILNFSAGNLSIADEEVVVIKVCRSDISLLRYDTQPSWFQNAFTLVSPAHVVRSHEKNNI